jgi:molybdate transport system substrate-binding protein
MRMRSVALAASVLGFVAQLTAQSTPVRMLVSNGVKAALDDLKPQCERAIGRPLAIQFGSTTGLKEKIDGGEAFDVTLLTTEAIDSLIKGGKLDAGTRVDLARCGVGLAVRSGAPKPDIHTPEALKRTLLKAKSIAYAGDGASRPFIEMMFQSLGITADVKPAIVLTKGSGPAMESVAQGKADIVLTLMSELLPVHGIDVVGAFPSEVQNYVNFSGAVASKTQNADAAKAVLRFLAGPGAAPTYKQKGMEPR